MTILKSNKFKRCMRVCNKRMKHIVEFRLATVVKIMAMGQSYKSVKPNRIVNHEMVLKSCGY